MPNTITEEKITSDPMMERLKKEKEVANKFQERRHNDWNDNYELYRNKVRTNRLTQRQAVNVPLMKETLNTILSGIDDPLDIEFKELSGDQSKELYLQEKWNNFTDTHNLEGIDIQDKKTVLLYGRSFIKLDIDSVNSLDIYDVVVDPLVNPLDIDTARFLIHQNIFRSLKEVLADKRYTGNGKRKLKQYLNTKDGMIQSGVNAELLKQKQERLEAMGVNDTEFNTFSAGSVILNLTEHHHFVWNAKQEKFIRYVTEYADNTVKLLHQPLKELIGVDFLPFVTWGDDVEIQDFWNDGPADLVRVPNKLLNVWLSQMTENRTLKNFQMTWYDSTIQGYQPQTYEPGPGRMLPAPGDPNKVLKAVDISGLEDTLDSIDFLIKLVEKGTSTPAIQKGVAEKRQITLGEVEILVGKAAEKTTTMTKFYRRARKELAEKWYKIQYANTSDSKTETLYKVSSKGKVWGMEIKGSDWKSKKGYKIMSRSTSEQEAEKTESLRRFIAVRAQFPENLALQRVLQKRSLEILDLSPDELREIEEEEKKKQEAPQVQPVQEQTPEDSRVAQNILSGVGELQELGSRI